MAHKSTLLIVCLCLLFGQIVQNVPSITGAPDDDGLSSLQDGIKHAYDLDIDEAIQKLNSAIHLGLSQADQILAYHYLALMYKAQGMVHQAEACLTAVLKLDTNYQLAPEFTGSDFEKIFQHVKAKADRSRPEIQHHPIQSAEANNDLPIEATVIDDREIEGVQISYQMAHHHQPQVLMMQPSSSAEIGEKRVYHAQIPSNQMQKGVMEYRIIATDAWNNRSETPVHRIEIEGKGRHWLWYAGGTVVGIVGYSIIAGRGDWPKSSPPAPPEE